MNVLSDKETTGWLLSLTAHVCGGDDVARDDAHRILALDRSQLHALLYAASEVRRAFKGNTVKTCTIINAKSGKCSENCSFCAQSAHHRAALDTYPLMKPDDMLERAAREEVHSMRCGIVTAGRGLNADELATVCRTVAGFQEKGLNQLPCASLGILSTEDFIKLKEAGLKRFHHNLETSRNYYPNVCTTHSYDERVATIKNAQAAGIELCIGGIFGLGESDDDRIDLLYETKALDPVSVPINFLVPIEGTPLATAGQMPLWEAVKLTALARLIMPDKDIKIGGGRLEVFRDAQHLVFLAGANGMIVGDLLTIKGRTPDDDLAVIADLGLEITS